MKKIKLLWLLIIILAISLIAGLIIFLRPQLTNQQKTFIEKANKLKAEIVIDETINAIGESPADDMGNVVFFSVSDGITRADVYHGSGNSLSTAWDNAVKSVTEQLETFPLWVRADIVCDAYPVDQDYLYMDIDDVSTGFYFNGIALDSQYQMAFLDGELNGWDIIDYGDECIDLTALNRYLSASGHNTLDALPEVMTSFDCWGWFMDEGNTIYPLYRDSADKSRRVVDLFDADYAQHIIDTASSYLANQVYDDGTFNYAIYPQFDEDSGDYNILRHAGTIWSLICRYRMYPDDALKTKIDSTIDYLLQQFRYDDDGTAYVFEADDAEFKLGGNGIAIVALTEYMDVFGTDNYKEPCIALGNGILKQQGDDGSYWHVLKEDMTKAEPFRTVYYDGECTFGLTRLYSLTGDQKWLDAACLAIDHFIAEDYTQYRDHWVAYSLNEVTKYVKRQDYYEFALLNATNNYDKIMGRARTYPTNLELLISAFETWQRMVEEGVDTGDFDVQSLLDAIDARANRQLSGYFYPEIAMYMQNPQRVLGSFMMRNSNFRVRIDDVQHNIGGYYLYWKNYDAMVDAGLDPYDNGSHDRLEVMVKADD